MPTVTRVRKELSSDGSHHHIQGVCTTDNLFYTRGQVVGSINQGNRWVTYANGREAIIRPISYCSAPSCTASPYITTRPDNSKDDNLENLPPC